MLITPLLLIVILLASDAVPTAVFNTIPVPAT
jgi:hypothetical protein